MAWSIVEDLQNGHKNERKVLKYFNSHEYAEDKFILYKDSKKQVDFRNTSIIGELKSRYNKYNQYPTTFFGANKIHYIKSLEDETSSFIFYFLFTDGLYSWDYKEGEYWIADFHHKEKGWIDQVYVPIDKLKLITKEISSIRN
tara:strand:- start:887 stop:1315 length:429 start_codon:yes stop_codon:yes gene_type:complete